MAKVAFITGVTGQDGSFLTEFLLEKGYEVHGLIRRSSNFNTQRIDHIYQDLHDGPNMHLHYGDLSDGTSLATLIAEIQPDEVYNLGAMSHVKVSFDTPEYTFDINATGVIRILDALRKIDKDVKFYQASSSEMFGSVKESPQNEDTRFYPRSAYAIAKSAGFYATVNYREAYRIHSSNGILFNHESERRGETFVTRKITRAATRIKKGLQDKLYLGNLDAARDWGYAKDYVEAMWLMLQQEKGDDYIIATGETYSVKEFLNGVFNYLDLNADDYVEIDKRYFRPAEVDTLCGDASKAKEKLGWSPKTTFNDLIKIMVDNDIELADKELYERENNGIYVPQS